MWRKFKNYDCLGTKIKNETSGDFEYIWKSYDEVHTDTQILAHAILKENFAADIIDTDFNLKLKTVGIVSINR